MQFGENLDTRTANLQYETYYQIPLLKILFEADNKVIKGPSSGEEIEEGEGMQIVLDEQGQERSVQYIEEEHTEYPGGTMEVILYFNGS